MAKSGDSIEARSEPSAVILNLQRALKHPGLIKAPPRFLIYLASVYPACIALAPIQLLFLTSRLPGFSIDWTVWVLVVLSIIGLAGTGFFVVTLLRKVNRFGKNIRQRIEQAMLLERIAQGPGELPNIFEYTPLPWRIMLGSHPKTLARFMQVVAFNIEWYLLATPKRYIKTEWKLLACVLCYPAVLASAFLLDSYLSSQAYQPGNPLNRVAFIIGAYCIMAPLLAAWWHVVFQMCCMQLTRQALRELISERYAHQ